MCRTKKEIFNAKLGSEDGKEKHTVVDYDEVSFFYANSRGITPKEDLYLEIRDSVLGRDPLLLHQANVKADQNGVIKQKIIWNNIKNKVNLLTVYAIIKEKNKDGKVLYDADGDYSMATAKLKKGSTLVKLVENKGAVKVGDQPISGGTNCGGKFCIKKGSPKSELIREINIRLAGFGGNVPTDEFTDNTEKMIKQFQRDYMKVPETGKVCGNVLKAIDDFTSKWAENIVDYKCLCHASDSKVKKENRCPGYGKGLNNEHPGIHRTLLWGVSALKFYLAQQNNYKFRKISAGYRCWAHNNSIPRKSTNHMGKAVDIQFNDGTYEISGKVDKNLKSLRAIRDKFYINYLKAEEGWSIPSKKNNYRMEPIGMGKDESYSWIHVDVTLFEATYLADSFFTKEQNSIIGKSIVDLANELGLKDICACSGGFTSSTNNTQGILGSCENRFSKVAPIILKHEGGYVNHPADKGGPTNKGITLATWKQYAKEDVGIENPTLENLKQITDEQATIIYRKRYWEPKMFCEIKDERVSLMFYDWTITSGGAVRQMQKLLKNEFQQDIEPDGGMGPLTVKAINNVEDQNKLLNRIAEIRKQYYTDLTYTNGKKNEQDQFLTGWLNRVDKCLEFKP
ncbi:glycosyl hydrolase 108 family protein [Chryseobacterium sp. NRRL B-14859]|uniref:glycosyl hydrolase 108 family protein n=1 Tax=Chryseobacterium sp. NRRL B-14859 TaxID=1562763 RepID=UPI00339897F5